MIDWSTRVIKFTSGIGVLGMAGLAAELTRNVVPLWLAIPIIMIPTVVFIFFRPSEMSVRVVKPCQFIAAMWYFVLAGALAILFYQANKRTPGWPLLFIFVAIGAIPCTVVLARIIGGSKTPSECIISANEELMAQISSARHQQFETLMAARKVVLDWATQHCVPLHRIEFVVPCAETDFTTTVWVFLTNDYHLTHTGQQARAEISAVFLDALRLLNYPTDWLQCLNFQFDSHEHIERDFNGNYVTRMRPI